MRLQYTIPLGRPVTNLVYTQMSVDSRPLKSSGVMTLCGEPWWCRWPCRPWFGWNYHSWESFIYMVITDQHTLDMWCRCRWIRDIIDLKGWLVSVDGLDLSWWRGSADLVCAGLRSTLLAHCPLLTPAAQLTLSSGCCVKSLFGRIEMSQINFEVLL